MELLHGRREREPGSEVTVAVLDTCCFLQCYNCMYNVHVHVYNISSEIYIHVLMYIGIIEVVHGVVSLVVSFPDLHVHPPE